jgi:hypothetical protein
VRTAAQKGLTLSEMLIIACARSVNNYYTHHARLETIVVPNIPSLSLPATVCRVVHARSTNERINKIFADSKLDLHNKIIGTRYARAAPPNADKSFVCLFVERIAGK